MKYLQMWGRLGEPTFNKAKVEINGHIFRLYFYGKHCGYTGWFYAEKEDGTYKSKPFVKLRSLERHLCRNFKEGG